MEKGSFLGFLGGKTGKILLVVFGVFFFFGGKRPFFGFLGWKNGKTLFGGGFLRGFWLDGFIYWISSVSFLPLGFFGMVF